MYEESAARFARDTGPHEHEEYLPYGTIGPRRLVVDRPHEMTILHDDGLYRHLRFRSPDHSSYWFDLITVPGSLIFRGDGESFVFAREQDMFGFFRHSNGYSIDPGYWSEKLTSARDASLKYDEDLFRSRVWDHVRNYGQEYRGLAKAVQEHFFDRWSDYDVSFEENARAALEEFRYEPEDSALPPFQFCDTWEWNLKGFDWWFLWACQAIVWGIARYDEARKPAKLYAIPEATVAS